MNKESMIEMFENLLDDFDGEFEDEFQRRTGNHPNRDYIAKVFECGCDRTLCNGNRATFNEYEISMPTCSVCGEPTRLQIAKLTEEDKGSKGDVE